jgi:nickel/cobalt transporter (NicO) family protein
MRRLLAAWAAAAILLAWVASPASAHPLGNYTVNRAVAVTLSAGRIEVLYLVDMAEIPAFTTIAEIDVDGDGAVSTGESRVYATATCGLVRRQLVLSVDGAPLALSPRADPELSFPMGAGGLQTLRLACHLVADLPDGLEAGTLRVADGADDGHVGWREVTIGAADGVRLTQADVPSRSPSANLTAYPGDRLETPPDVRNGQASFAITGTPLGENPSLVGAPAEVPTALDPLARLLGAELSPSLLVLALLLAAGLGAAHALSPGHGKTLVAAYLVGSRGTIRQAMALGVTVAATHTCGVLVLGGLVLVAGELLLPETVIGWLTIASGSLMAVLGAALLWRAMRRQGTARNSHDHDHDHAAAHAQGRAHQHHDPGRGEAPALTVRGVALLGIAGGLVPSASALIVLLAAITTGRLAFGLTLILAFGAGMAVVLGGLAVATTLVRGWLGSHLGQDRGGAMRHVVGLLPIGSGLLVLGIGLAIVLGAAGRLA